MKDGMRMSPTINSKQKNDSDFELGNFNNQLKMTLTPSKDLQQ